MSGSVTAHDRPESQQAGGLWLAGLSAALFSAQLLGPGLGMLAAIAPFPVALLRIRTNFGVTITAALLTAAVVGVALSAGEGLVFLAFFAAPGLLIGEGLARGRGLVRGCVWAAALWALLVGVLLLSVHETLAAQALAPFDYYRSPQFLAAVHRIGFSDDQARIMTEQAETLRRAVAVVYPALFVVLGGILALVNGALVRTYLARRDPGWLEGGEFEGIRWPFGLAVLFVVSGGSVFVEVLRPAAYNALLVLGFCFAVQGLAVVAYYVRRLAAPLLFRGAVLVLVLLNPWVFQILGLLGLFDLWFDFRKWAEPPRAEG